MTTRIMQLTLGILIILTFQLAYGQDTRPVNKRSNGFREEYNVLTTDQNVKHGNYRRYKGKNLLIIEGTFDNNSKVGEWKFYNSGELEQTYDFTLKELKYAKKPEHVFKAVVNGTTQDIQLDTPPLYIGSKTGLHDELNKVMTYPYQALRMGVEGKVVASLWVNENGTISDIKVIQGIMNECNNEVINGLNKVEQNWIAGTKDGNKIKAELLIVIEFKLHDNGDKTITVL